MSCNAIPELEASKLFPKLQSMIGLRESMEQHGTDGDLTVEISNTHGPVWCDNIKISHNNKKCYVVKDELTTMERYELTHLIFSYKAFSSYVSGLENVSNNKPLSLVHLGFINYNNIIQPMDNVEHSIKLLKIATCEMHDKISNDIYGYIKCNKITYRVFSMEYALHVVKTLFGIRK